MDAGAYRGKVKIEKATRGKDSHGYATEEWLKYYENYAYVNNLSGVEFWAAAQSQAQETVRFEMRYHKALDQVQPKNFRIVFRGRIYRITFVDNVQMKNETVKINAVRAEA